MFCTFCGKEKPDDAPFCPYCGKGDPLQQMRTQQGGQMNSQQNAMAGNAGGSSKLHIYNQSPQGQEGGQTTPAQSYNQMTPGQSGFQTAPTQGGYPQMTPPPKKSNVGLVVAFCAVAVVFSLIGGLIVYALFRSGYSSKLSSKLDEWDEQGDRNDRADDVAAAETINTAVLASLASEEAYDCVSGAMDGVLLQQQNQEAHSIW